MSTHYSAYAVIGLRVNKEQLFTTEQQPICDCNKKQSKFCSECGLEFAWKDVDIPIERLDVSGDQEFDLEYSFQGKNNTYKVQLERDWDGDIVAYYIVLVHAECTDFDRNSIRTKLPVILETQQMKEDMDDLWDDELFGIWTILYVS